MKVPPVAPEIPLPLAVAGHARRIAPETIEYRAFTALQPGFQLKTFQDLPLS
jgi:hypothetical protein